MSAGAARLKYSMKTLREHWEITKEQWADGVARDFEKEHLVPLEQQVNTTLRGMDKINDVLSRVRHECGDAS